VPRRFLSCAGTPALSAGLACSNIGNVSDWGCGQEYNVFHFVPLTGADLNTTCLDFYKTQTPTGYDDQNQNVINARFSAVPGSSCSSNAQCGESEICRAGSCWPMTTPGACGGGAACRTGWTCGSDSACWPTAELCPQP
jgi:hypothetical protein